MDGPGQRETFTSKEEAKTILAATLPRMATKMRLWELQVLCVHFDMSPRDRALERMPQT